MIISLSSFKIKEAENLNLLELSVLSPPATCTQLTLHLLLFLSMRESIEMEMEMCDQPAAAVLPTGPDHTFLSILFQT